MNKSTGNLSAALLLALGFLGVGQANALQLLTEENFPFNFTKDGKLTGTSVDVLTDAAKRADVKITIESLDWPTAYRRAQAEIETCIFSIARLPDRENLFRWVAPIGMNRWSVFAAASSNIKIKGLPELRKYKLGGVKSDAKSEFLKNKGISLAYEFENDQDIAKSLYAAADHPTKIDFWVGGAYEAPRVAEKLKLAAPKEVLSFHETPLFLACSPRTPKAIVEKLKTALDAMQQDGTAKRLANPVPYLSR